MSTGFDLEAVRAQFPALKRQINGRPAVYLDNPGGTQIPAAVAEAMTDYLVNHNANHGGPFATSRESDALTDQAHEALADFMVAPGPDTVIFGANMTTLTLHISRSIGRELRPGDEVVVTRMDHDANVTPWLMMAADAGATVRWVDLEPDDCTLPLASFEAAITDKTKVVAVGYASNASGTINPVAEVTKMAQAKGAMVYIDAVAYAPHGPINVTELGCDFLVCSPYKFFGPHAGALYGKKEHLDRLTAYKVRPAPTEPPGKFETGTGNFEAMCGAMAAVNYLADLGRTYGQAFEADHPGLSGRQLHLKTAYDLISAHERTLSAAIIDALTGIDGITVHGITDKDRLAQRVPTFSFTWAGRHPADIAAALGEEGIFTWDGNYYALCLTERLGVEEAGGMVRVGAAHYNTLEEIDRLAEALKKMA